MSTLIPDPFSMKMKDATILKNLFAAIATLVDEAKFEIDAEKISLRAMDPSRVAMIDFEWPKTAFEEFNCAAPMKLCISITELLKLVRRAGKDETINLSYNTSGRLVITILGKTKRTFDMPTLEPGEEEVPIPKVTFNTKARAESEVLKNALEDATLVSDHVKFEADNQMLTINAKGDLMNAKIEISKENGTLLALEVKEPSKSVFSLSYLTEIFKAAIPLSAIVNIEFSTDMPIRIDFEQEKEGKLTYYLAPRIEVE